MKRYFEAVLLFSGSALFLVFMAMIYGFLCGPMLEAAARNPFENMYNIIHGLVLHGVAIYVVLVLFPLSLAPYRAVRLDALLRRMMFNDALYIYLPILIPVLVIIAYYKLVAADMPPGLFAGRFLDMVGMAEITYMVLSIYVAVLGVPLSTARAAGLRVRAGRLALYGAASMILAKIIGLILAIPAGFMVHGTLVSCSAESMGINSLNPNLPKLEEMFTITSREAAGMLLLPLLYFHLLTGIIGSEELEN